MISSMLAYDADGNVISTLDHLVARDTDGNVIGLHDFAAHEAAGGKLRAFWTVDGATGSGTWPEWLGPKVHDYRVEIKDKRIVALVHKTSGHRRERVPIEAAIEAVPVIDGARDIRSIVGGPQKPLCLDDQVQNAPARLA